MKSIPLFTALRAFFTYWNVILPWNGYQNSEYKIMIIIGIGHHGSLIFFYRPQNAVQPDSMHMTGFCG